MFFKILRVALELISFYSFTPLFRGSARAKEKRRDAIASDRTETKIGFLVATALVGSVDCMLISLS